ncbi:hypothetical protein [Micromonospora sp. RP3T]|uniref:hypothetical protein n=1 Tax=Micromonospora sp. RP3T TaxID=2135446 RepID=UPI003D742923
MAVLSLLSMLMAVVTPMAERPATAATRTWTGLVDCYGNLTNTGLTLKAGDQVQVTINTGLCYFYPGRPSNRTPGEGLTSRIGARDFTYGAPVTATAPVDGGLVFFFGDSLYSDNSGYGYTVTVTVTSASVEKCRGFTTTSRYLRVTVADLYRGAPIPAGARNYLDRIVIADGLAYMQLKGSWCYKDNRVTWKDIRPVQAALSGAGISGLVFSVERKDTGAVSLENYGSGASRYRISQTKSVVYLEVPVAVNLTIPGTDVGITIPAGARRPIYTMVMDTLLTGAGNVSCAATDAAPCTAERTSEYTR